MRLSRTPPPPPTVGDDADGSRALAAAEAALSRVRGRQQVIDDELRRLAHIRWAQHLHAEGEPLDAAAQALLRGEDVPAPPSVEDQIKALQAERTVVERAVQIARQNRAAAARFHAARIVDRLRPAHRAAVHRIAEALAELSAANAAELELHRHIPGGGASLAAAAFPGVGGIARWCGSPAAHWLETAVRLGLLDSGDVDELRAKAG